MPPSQAAVPRCAGMQPPWRTKTHGSSCEHVDKLVIKHGRWASCKPFFLQAEE